MNNILNLLSTKLRVYQTLLKLFPFTNKGTLWSIFFGPHKSWRPYWLYWSRFQTSCYYWEYPNGLILSPVSLRLHLGYRPRLGDRLYKTFDLLPRPKVCSKRSWLLFEQSNPWIYQTDFERYNASLFQVYIVVRRVQNKILSNKKENRSISDCKKGIGVLLANSLFGWQVD